MDFYTLHKQAIAADYHFQKRRISMGLDTDGQLQARCQFLEVEYNNEYGEDIRNAHF